MTMADVGDLLLRKQLVSAEQLQHARDARRKVGGSLPAMLAELGYVAEEKLLPLVAQAAHLAWVGPQALEQVPQDVLAYLTRDLAERYRAVPLRLDGHELEVCVGDPDRLEELGDLARALGRGVRPVLSTEAAVTEALDRHYGVRPELRFSRVTERASPEQVRLVERQVERTGIIKVPTGLSQLAPEPTPESAPDILDQLAAANSARDLVTPVFRFVSALFPEVAVLGFHKGTVQVLVAGTRQGPRALPTRVSVPLEPSSLVGSVLARPQVCHRASVADASVVALCQGIGIPAAQLCLVPIVDGGRPVFLILGQGCDDTQVRAVFDQLKSFVVKVTKAVRIVVLKAELRAS